MRVYNMGQSSLWILIGFAMLSFMLLIGLGGFLFGTPLGWAIITLLIIRHYYRKHQLKKHFSEAYSNNANTEYKTTYADKTDMFEQKSFSRQEAQNAVDVEFKEV